MIRSIFEKSPKVTDLKAYDASAWSLVCANFFTIGLAFFENWSLSETMLVYWFQNIIIGGINVVRIATFTGFQNVVNADDRKKAGMVGLFLAGFFAVHYGFFHYGYWSFLRGWSRQVDMKFVLLSAGVFLINHVFSFIHNLKKDRSAQKPGDLARMMFFPYMRIMPMHMTIIIGGMVLMLSSALKINLAEKLVLLFFLLLKTGTDVKMHFIEHQADREE